MVLEDRRTGPVIGRQRLHRRKLHRCQAQHQHPPPASSAATLASSSVNRSVIVSGSSPVSVSTSALPGPPASACTLGFVAVPTLRIVSPSTVRLSTPIGLVSTSQTPATVPGALLVLACRAIQEPPLELTASVGRYAVLDDQAPRQVSPGGPCGPVAPVAPVGPCGPCTPWTPCAPSAPVAPSAPAGPVGPTAPGAPCGPCGPVAPAAPSLPDGPVAPGGPCGPSAPSAPSTPAGPGGPGGPTAPLLTSTISIPEPVSTVSMRGTLVTTTSAL